MFPLPFRFTPEARVLVVPLAFRRTPEAHRRSVLVVPLQFRRAPQACRTILVIPLPFRRPLLTKFCGGRGVPYPVRPEIMTLRSMRSYRRGRLVTGTGSLQVSVNIVLFLASYAMGLIYLHRLSLEDVFLCDLYFP